MPTKTKSSSRRSRKQQQRCSPNQPPNPSSVLFTIISPSQELEEEKRKKEEEERDSIRDWGSTLDLDLLDSLLSKDILNDMGQVILNNELTAKCGDNDDVKSDTSFNLSGGEYNFEYDLFEGLFAENKLKDDDDLIRNFDSSDWESAFTELFPQL